MDVQVLVHSKFLLVLRTERSASCLLSLAPDFLQYQRETESLEMEQVYHGRS